MWVSGVNFCMVVVSVVDWAYIGLDSNGRVSVRMYEVCVWCWWFFIFRLV